MRDAILPLKDVRRDRSQHAGLILQRYLFHPADGSEQWTQEKRAVLEAASAGVRHPGVRELYKAVFDRWSSSFPEPTAQVDLQTTGRLIVGLGSENVLETGIRLHHTYGVPMIPGSALKGLAAHYCDRVWGLENQTFQKPSKEEDEAYQKYLKGVGPNPGQNYHRLLFGTTDDSGCIVFHDAWLTPESLSHDRQGALRLDVMTSHHPDYQLGPGSPKFKPPTDFDGPNPVLFLSVAGRFRVAVSWNGPASDQSQCWTETALKLLKQALAAWGIGGKTSSGYGRLIEPKRVPQVSAPQQRSAKPVSSLPQAGDRVEAVLLEEKTKKGGWKAQHDPSGFIGPIQNSVDVPQDKQPGERVTLVVASINEQEIAFRYPTAVDEQLRYPTAVDEQRIRKFAGNKRLPKRR